MRIAKQAGVHAYAQQSGQHIERAAMGYHQSRCRMRERKGQACAGSHHKSRQGFTRLRRAGPVDLCRRSANQVAKIALSKTRMVYGEERVWPGNNGRSLASATHVAAHNRYEWMPGQLASRRFGLADAQIT